MVFFAIAVQMDWNIYFSPTKTARGSPQTSPSQLFSVNMREDTGQKLWIDKWTVNVALDYIITLSYLKGGAFPVAQR